MMLTWECPDCGQLYNTYQESCGQCSNGMMFKGGAWVKTPPNKLVFVKEQDDERPSWPETWMQVAKTIAERSYDPRLKVGAIIVSDDNTQMLSVGYNGNYKGGPHEHESDIPGQSGFIHAEVNAIVKCDFNFAKKKHMYVTHSPCRACAKLIINAEITRVVYAIEYRDASSIELLKSAGIEVFGMDAILMPRVR